MSYEYLPDVAEVPVRLGRPEDLPGDVPSVARHAEVARRLLDPLARPAARVDLEAYRAAVDAARRDLTVPLGRPVGEDPAESEPNAANDEAFGIIRMDAPPMPLLVRAAGHALAGVIDLVARRGTSLPESEWAELLGGIEAMLGWLVDPRRAPAGLGPVPPPAPIQPPQPADALRQWVRGHHLFMVIAEGCAVSLGCLTSSAARGDLATAVAGAVTATALMTSSRAALRFAGDVLPEDYRAEIRPTLMPPIAPPKLTGLHWRDHEELVRRLKASAPGWAWLSEHRPDLLTNFRREVDRAYQAHRGVCEHFVGDRSPSLLATARSTRPAGEVIDQFRRMRLDMLPVTGPDRTEKPE